MQITVEAVHPSASNLDFAIPAWTPGYYQILHYENSIEDVRAQDEAGRPLALTHPTPRVWRAALPPAPQPRANVILTYRVRADEDGLGFFASSLHTKQREGYINGASAFMYISGGTDLPVSLNVKLPAHWRIATPLKQVAPLQFTASSYDEMIDCPIQVGDFASYPFEAGGAQFQIVVVGKQDADRSKLVANVKAIAEAGLSLFGNTPFDRYIFFYHCGGAGFGGGLEHHNSTVIHIGGPLKDGSRDEFLAVTAHEFFHAWNVKRIHPEGLGPFDYTREVRSPSIWWAEGVTDYFADVLLLHAKLRTVTWFLHDMAGRIAELDGTPARANVTLETASLKAWEGGSMGFNGLSYYLKGSLMGFYFDLRIRESTQGRKGLDDVLRVLDAEYGAKGSPYPPGSILAALDRVAGADLHEDYDRYVQGTAEIPWDTVLHAAGLDLHRDGHAYLGVRLSDDQNVNKAAPTGDDAAEDSAVVASVVPGLAGSLLGLKPGDRILAVNGAAVTKSTLSEVVKAVPAETAITIQVRRDGVLASLTGSSGIQYTHHTLKELPDDQISISTRQVRDSALPE